MNPGVSLWRIDGHHIDPTLFCLSDDQALQGIGCGGLLQQLHALYRHQQPRHASDTEILPGISFRGYRAWIPGLDTKRIVET